MPHDPGFNVSWFETAFPDGPAYGEPETMAWDDFAGVIEWSRREGDKDGCAFVPARFTLEPDGRQVRRKRSNVIARTAVAHDIETSKTTGEIPPDPAAVAAMLQGIGLAGVVYTSHSHSIANIRYRIVLPLEAEIAPELPAPEVVADRLGLLGVLDRSKINAASLFYLPSCPYGLLDQHVSIVVPGVPLETAWVTAAAGALLAERQAEADRIAMAAHAAAAERREARIAAGFNPGDSLIEKIRSRFDLESVLTSHGYARSGSAFRHPNSQSGSYGASIKAFAGIDRVFSHNGTDPLHAENLPEWCDVTAIDAFDAVVILEFGGDRDRALRGAGHAVQPKQSRCSQSRCRSDLSETPPTRRPGRNRGRRLHCWIYPRPHPLRSLRSRPIHRQPADTRREGCLMDADAFPNLDQFKAQFGSHSNKSGPASKPDEFKGFR